MASPELKAILFDAVGTLIRPEPSAAEVYAAVGHRHGSQCTAVEVVSRFRAAFNHQEAIDRDYDGLRTSEVRECRRWEEIVRSVLFDVTDPASCFEELYRHFATPQAWRCLTDASETLDWLVQRGFFVGIASNYDNRLHSVLAGMPELRGIRHVAISSEIGWRKPAGEFFAELCRRLDLPHERVLLVGDDFANDYEGARAAGLQAVLLDPLARVPGVPRLAQLGDLPRWLELASWQP